MRYLIIGTVLIFSFLCSFTLPIVHSQSLNYSPLNSDVEKNKHVVKELINVFNNRSLTALDNIVAKDIKEHRPGAGQGIDATKGFLVALKTAFPDFKTNITQMVAEGDKVIVFTNTTGTHKGPFIFAPGLPPTGKVVSFQTADLYTIKEGKIVEHQDVIEFMQLLQMIGAITFTHSSFSPSSSLSSSSTS